MSKRQFESGASKRKKKSKDLFLKCANDKTQKKLNCFIRQGKFI